MVKAIGNKVTKTYEKTLVLRRLVSNYLIL